MVDTYYGAPEGADSSKTLGERLRDLYSAEDFVTVFNVDTEPVVYQYANPADIETFSDYPGHKDTVQKRPPQVNRLSPGEKKLCPAYEADILIQVLIKQIAQKNTQSRIDTGEFKPGQATNWNDPVLIKDLLKQIYLGKQDIIGSYNESMQKPKNKAAEDLQLDGTRSKKVA